MEKWVRLQKIFNQIGGQLAFLGVPRRSCGPHYGHVQSALAACFGDKAAWHSGGGVYVWLADKAQQFEKKTRVVASMDSDLHKNPRKLVVCHKVVVSGSSKKRQMQLVSKLSASTIQNIDPAAFLCLKRWRVK